MIWGVPSHGRGPWAMIRHVIGARRVAASAGGRYALWTVPDRALDAALEPGAYRQQRFSSPIRRPDGRVFWLDLLTLDARP